MRISFLLVPNLFSKKIRVQQRQDFAFKIFSAHKNISHIKIMASSNLIWNTEDVLNFTLKVESVIFSLDYNSSLCVQNMFMTNFDYYKVNFEARHP